VEKLFFNKGFRNGLILLGTADKHDFSRKNVSFFFTQTFCSNKICLPRFLGTIANLPNNAWAQNNLEKHGTIANLDTNQDATSTNKGFEHCSFFGWRRIPLISPKSIAALMLLSFCSVSFRAACRATRSCLRISCGRDSE